MYRETTELPEEAKVRIEEAAKVASNVPEEKNNVFLSVTQAFETGLQIGKLLQENEVNN